MTDGRTEPAVLEVSAILEAYDGLLESWDRYRQGSGIRIRRGTNRAKFYVSYCLCAHSFRVGRAVRELLADDFAAECLPLVRSMYEFALTAQWVVQVDQAVESFVKRSLRDKRKTIAIVPALRIPGHDADDVARALAEIDEETLTGHQRADFKNICLDLAEPAGEAAYAHWRVLTGYCHPTEFLIGRYLDFGSDPDDVFMRMPPDLPPLAGWASTALASLMWAAAAVDFVDPEHELRPGLQRVETLLGLKRVLRPSERVLKRT